MEDEQPELDDTPEWRRPEDAIAEFIGCNALKVYLVFREIKKHQHTPELLNEMRDVTHALNDSVRHAENLHRALQRLPLYLRDDLIRVGAVTPGQILHLKWVLSTDHRGYDAFFADVDRRGGKNVAAHAVAEGIAILFSELSKKITFGSTPDGAPSTEFGRAVEFAIGAFGIRGDWRRPAENAFRNRCLSRR